MKKRKRKKAKLLAFSLPVPARGGSCGEEGSEAVNTANTSISVPKIRREAVSSLLTLVFFFPLRHKLLIVTTEKLLAPFYQSYDALHYKNRNSLVSLT